MILLPARPACTLCPLHARCKTVGIPGDVWLVGEQGGRALVLLGQSPGAEEDASGKPFVGRSGAELRKWVAGLQAEVHDMPSVYVLNTVRCFPPDHKVPVSAINKCFPMYSRADISRIVARHDETIVLAMGAPAAQAVGKHLLERKKLSLTGLLREHPIKLHPWPDLKPPWNNLTIMGTYHPAAKLRNGPKFGPQIGAHLDLLVAYLNGTLPGDVQPDLVDPETLIERITGESYRTP